MNVTSRAASDRRRRLGSSLLCLAMVAATMAFATPAIADGTPDLQLAKDMPDEVLLGAPVPVTLTMTNPGGPDGFNVTFTDVLPVGVSYVGGSSSPEPTVLPQGDGTTVLVWENVADALTGASVSIGYSVVGDGSFDVGDSIDNAAGVYANADARTTPNVDPVTGVVVDGFTGSATATDSSSLIPFELTKSEPSAEDELLRGLHDHQTVYTLTIENNLVNPTNDFSIVDFIPAELEFLGCGTVDNSAAEEYPGAGVINPGNAPAMANPCVVPSSVTTVDTDPDGAGPMPSGVYTRVEWNVATLATSLPAGGTASWDYIAAIPLQANTLATLTDTTANLDNNTGAVTTESETSVRNYAIASGDYNGAGPILTDDDIELVVIEDVSIHKTVDSPSFEQGATPTFTLLVESSEYALSTGPITVTDTVPSSLDITGASPAFDAVPGEVLNSDGTITVTWTLPAFSAPSATSTITLNTEVREFYRLGDGSDGPAVFANDTHANVTDLATETTVIVDSAGTTDTNDVVDESAATQSASGPSIEKEVGEPVAGVLTCGDGSGITFDPDQAGDYRPGDRVCFRLIVDFPGALDTLTPTVTDFLPAGFEFESWATGPGSTVAAGDLTFTDADPRLEWDLSEVDAGALRLELVIQTRIFDPGAAADADIVENLMKFRFANLAGEVFQLRDAALADWAEPQLDLVKGVAAVNTVAVPGAPADGVTVEETDTVTYQLDITNSGTIDAFDVSVRDVLPAELSCADVVAASISNGGSCDAANGWIQWDAADAIPVDAGATTSLTYDLVIPVGVSAGASLVNEAGVRTYQGPTNTGTPFEFVPGDNIDDTLTSNTDPADDPSDVVTSLPTIEKTRTTALNEAGNNTGAEATIGEIVSFTVDVELSGGVTYFNGVISDDLTSEYDLDATSVAATIDGGVLPAGFTLVVDDAGNRFELQLPASYSVPSGSTQDVQLTFDARVTDVASNTRNSTARNDAVFDFQNATGEERSIDDAVSARIVEPNIVLDKAHDDGDGVVTAGQTLTYTLSVTNDDAIPRVSVAHETVVVDTIPPELIVQEAPGDEAEDGDLIAPDNGVWNATLRTITWQIAEIDPGDTVTLDYEVITVDPLIASSAVRNTAVATTSSMPGDVAGERSATSSNGDETGDGYTDPAEATVTVPVLDLTKTGSPASATVGEPIAYEIDVTVPAGIIAYDVTVLDQLPAGVVYESLTSVVCDEGGGACSPDVATGDATVILDGADLAFFFDDLVPGAAADRTITISYVGVVADVAAADDGATLTNGAQLVWNSADTITTPPTTPPDPADFDDTTAIDTHDVATVEPTLTIDKDVAGQSGDDDTRRAVPGETLSYTLTITNTGSSDAHDLTIVDVATDTSWAFTDTTVAGGVVNTDATPVGGLEWTFAGPLAPTDSLIITYDLTVPLGYDESDEVAGGPEQTNVADVPSYFGVDETTRTANPTRDYREYDDVSSDEVTIELDLASIGDLLWHDVDGDGIRDAGEPPLADIDVVVTYLGPDGVLGGGDDETVTVTTDAAGLYLVEDLPGGQYLVDVDETDPDLPAGMAPSYDLDGGTASPNGLWTGALGEDEAKRDVDFGFTGTGSIGDTIWFDQNTDGVIDPNEAGLGGVDVTVTWLGPDGVAGGGDDVSVTVTTATDGSYLVENLPAGEYVVEVDTADIPSGFANVSDPNGGNDSTSALTLGDGEDRLDQDFGYAGTGSIGDLVWLDQDSNGAVNGGEPGLGGVIVELTWFGIDGVPGGGDDAVFTTTTDPNGNYDFTGLPPGEYEVAITGAVPANVTNTFDPDTAAPGDSVSSVSLGLGEDNDDQDFGYGASSVLGDRVWFDVDRDGVQDPGESGINGVEVTALYLGPDGVVGGGDDVTFVTTTDGDGDYLFQNVPDGDYVITVTGGVPTGLGITYDEDSGTVGPDETTDVDLDAEHLTADFGYAGTSGLGDTVWFDTDGDGVLDGDEVGIPGVDVIVTWFGPDGVAGGGDDIDITTTTAADGTWSVPNLPAGDFSVTVDPSTLPPGLNPTYDLDSGTTGPDGETDVSLAIGEVNDNVDFGVNGSGEIGDTIWFDLDADGVLDPGEVGLGGVDVDVIWDSPFGPVTFSTTTAADGTYLVEGLPPGDYTVVVDTATLPGSMVPTFDDDGGFDSASMLTLADGESNLDQDFGYTGSAALGDTIYLDLDGSGTQEPGEPGIPGQIVEIEWDGPSGPVTITTTTDGSGNYLVENLPDGDYTVTVVGGIADNATNSADPNGGGDSTSAATITGGVDILDQDFGYTGDNEIGDQVWYDADADGLFDGDEVGIPGVVIEVVWLGVDGVPSGDDVPLPLTMTDASGQYSVPGLPDGTYTVTPVAGVPAGIDDPTYDGDDLIVDPDATSTVTDLGVGNPTPVVDDTQDFGFTGSSAVGDTIWLDADGDGAVDPGEQPIPGATVTVTSGGLDGVIGTADDRVVVTTTDADGMWLVEHLPPGPVTVVVTDLPGGVDSTFDPDGGDDDRSALTLAPGEINLDQDFGYIGSGSIGDTVWIDLDGDGEQDPGEAGVPGLDITIVNGGADGVIGTADDIVITTTTDANGQYLAEGLPSGAYEVSYDPADLPPGLVPTSDLDDGDPVMAALLLGDGEDRRDVDFAVRGDASLRGVVWVDTDGDGEQDPGENGVAGVTVTLYDPSGNPVATTVTGPDGSYLFTDLPPGDYAVEIDPATIPPQYRTTSDIEGLVDGRAAVTVGPGENVVDVDFGLGPVVGGTGDGLPSTGRTLLPFMMAALIAFLLGAALLIAVSGSRRQTLT